MSGQSAYRKNSLEITLKARVDQVKGVVLLCAFQGGLGKRQEEASTT